MAIDNPIPIDSDDVRVRRLDPCNCEDCPAPATHYVQIDIREMGAPAVFGKFCEYHANRRADQIRLALPNAPNRERRKKD